MRSFLFITLAAVFLLTSCSAPQEPEFEQIKNITTRMLSPDEVLVSGIAVYKNPNAFGGDLTAMDIDVQVDDIAVGKLDQKLTVSVSANSSFEVPFEFRFDPAKIFKKKGILGSVISILENKSVDIKYQGSITMEMMDLSFDIPVDYNEAVFLGN